MDIEILIADIVTLLLSTRFAYKNFRNILGNMYSVVYLIFFVFYVFPLYLDYFVSFPDYSQQERYLGFDLSVKDVNTRIVYDFFVIAIQMLFMKLIHKKTHIENLTSARPVRDVSWFLIAGMLFPTIMTLIFPVDKGILYTFGWRELDMFVYNSATHTIEDFSYFGVLCSLLLLFNNNSNVRSWRKILYILFLYINMCVQGKRSIMFFAIVSAVLILLPGVQKDTIDKEKERKRFIYLAIASVVGIIVMLFVTVYVKVAIRGWDANDAMELYTMTRIDFLKDDRVRFAIYSMLYPEKVTILNDIGQTVFPIITWFYPINAFLAQRGYVYLSYQDYFSDALQHVVNQPFMTTSIFAEFLSNFGVIGPLVMLLLMSFVAKKATSNSYPFRAILLISFLALQMYTTKYLAIFFELCIIYSVLYYYANRKRVK